jgi:hypothetical protein
MEDPPLYEGHFRTDSRALLPKLLCVKNKRPEVILKRKSQPSPVLVHTSKHLRQIIHHCDSKNCKP